MNKFIFFILCTQIFISCQRRECTDFTNFTIDEEVKKYFHVYPVSGDKYIFSNGTSNDTLRISLEQIQTDTISSVWGGLCETNNKQGILIKGQNFVDTAVYILIISDRGGTILDAANSNRTEAYFAMYYDRTKKSFHGGNETIKILDSLKTSNETYFEVIQANNTSNNTTFYFAKSKGLIRWIEKNKIYDFKN